MGRNAPPIRIPSELTASTFRQKLKGQFRITAKHSGEIHWDAHFEPPTGLERIVVEVPHLHRFTAEGLCDVLGLLEWMKSENKVPIVVKGEGNLPRQDSVSRSGEPRVLALVEVALPSFEAVGSEGDKKNRADIEKRSNEILSDVALGLGSLLLPGLETCLAEFVYEGLLNSYEHAFTDPRPRRNRSAWVCVVLVPANDTAFIEHTFDHELATSDGSAVRSCSEACGRAQWFLEAVVLDTGASLPNTLEAAYLRQAQQSGKVLDLRGKRAYVPIHNDILQYAFSPYGTRKVLKDFESRTLASGWRGLYRLRFYGSSVPASLLLRSGFALTGFIHGESGEVPVSLRYPENEPFVMPGTALLLRAPLPLEQGRFSPTVRRISEEELTTGHFTTVESRQEHSLSDSATVISYSAAAAEAIRPFTEIGRSTEHPFVLVFHLPWALEADDGAATAVRKEDTFAVNLAKILGDNALPGFIPVHCFIEAPAKAIEMAQGMFPGIMRDSERERIPRIVGLYSLARDEISWFISDKAASGAEIAIRGALFVPDGEDDPSWLDEIRLAYPNAIVRRGVSAGREFRLTLPAKASFATLSSGLSAILPKVAALNRPGKEEWYWEASSTPPKELVRTSSGRLVANFVGVLRLCVAEPVIETTMILLLERHLRWLQRKNTANKIAIVPDSPMASFLLLKRLFKPLENKLENVRVLHPDQVVRDLKDGEAVLLFTDAVRTGAGLKRRCGELAARAAVSGSFACLDLQPTEAENIPDLTCAARWPLPRSITDPERMGDEDIYPADPATHEIIRDRTHLEEVAWYGSLVWKNSTVQASTPTTSDVSIPCQRLVEDITSSASIFDYGLQEVQGQWHVVRCSVSKLFDTEFAGILAEWLATVLREVSLADRDVVLFFRDESVFVQKQKEDARNALFSNLYSHLSAEGWQRDLFFVELPSTKRGHRQRLVRRPSFYVKQMQHIPREHFSRDVPQMTFGFDAHRPASGFVALYLDNAAMTARTLREYVLVLSSLPTNQIPSAIVVCPVVSRLSPSEEKLLLLVPSLRSDSHGTVSDVSFSFRSLIQLRVGAYPDLGSVPAVAKVRELLAGSDKWGEIGQWADAVSRKLQSLEARSQSEPEQHLLWVGDERNAYQVSGDAVLFRHLLAVYDQGFATLVQPLVDTFRRIYTRKDKSILILLALEPDLLDDPLLAGSLSDDIRDLALEALDRETSPGLRSDALWVLFCQKNSFVAKRRDIARHCGRDDAVRCQWMAQCLAFTSPEREAIIEDSLDVLLQEGAPDVRSLRGQLIPLRTRRFTSLAVPQTGSDARKALYQFFRAGRAFHGKEGCGAWYCINEAVVGRSYESVDNEVWKNAHLFLRHHIVPAIQALPIVAEANVRTPRDLVNKAEAAFIRAQDAFVDDRVVFEASWAEVRNSTLVSIEAVFCDQEYVLAQDNADDPTSVGGAVGGLGGLLAQVVVEPVSLLLYIMDADLRSDHEYSLELTEPSRVPYVFSRTADADSNINEWLSARWTAPQGAMPLMWGDVRTLRRIFRLLAGNLRDHSQSRFRVLIKVNAATNGKNGQFRLYIESQKSLKDSPGAGRGHAQIAQECKTVNGRFRWRLHNGRYQALLCVPVKLWRSAPLGSTE